MVDEMKVPKGVKFDKNTLQVVGFVDIGKHTPKNQKNVLGDHVAVIIFRPFSGKWYQTLGVFLSKSNIKGDILHKLMLEGISMMERRSIYVDAIVSDAAGWNRNMWEHFGIDFENNTVEHPIDSTRKLYFFSDWCHLLKCMRNLLCPLPPKRKNKKRMKKAQNHQEQVADLEDIDDPLAEHEKQRETEQETEQETQLL